MFQSNIPCGNKVGSGASGSRNPSVNKSLIVLNGPAVFASVVSAFSAVVCSLASAKTIPSSVVWSVLSISSNAAPVVVTATWLDVLVELSVAAVLYLYSFG